MSPPFELARSPNQHINGYARAPKNFVGQPASAPLWGSVIRHDEEEIAIAVRSGLAAGDRPEEIHALRLVGLHQAANNFIQCRIVDSRRYGLFAPRHDFPCILPQEKARRGGRGAVLHEYTFDKKKAPQSLEDLVREGYLRQIPIDPMTGSDKTWVVIMEDALTSVDQTEPGIYDVRSGSDRISLEGTP